MNNVYVGLIVSVADFDEAARLAVIVAVTCFVTTLVVTANVAEVFPAAIVTVPGTVAELLPLAKLIIIPPEGAAAPIVTVPVDDFPPTTDAGLSVSPVIAGGLIVSVADFETPFKLAPIIAAVGLDTAEVFTVNVAELLPAATFTVLGTLAAL